MWFGIAFIFIKIFCIIYIQGKERNPCKRENAEGKPHKPESENLMKVHIEFEHEWTLDEIKDFLHNMETDEYASLSDSEYLELAACAESYLRQKIYTDDGITRTRMNEIAMEDIQHGIEDHLSEYAEEGYIIYYLNVIREFLLEACENLE